MIRFVIVEDDEENLSIIKRIIDKEKYKAKQEIKTYEFAGYSKELQNIINNVTEKTVYILDIELKDSKSGIEIASLIRNDDWDSEIIFITNHDRMFETVHRSVFEVFDFIEKYLDLEKRLTKDIKLILEKNKDKTVFSYKGRNVDLQLYFNSIEYIYRDKEDRKAIIVTDEANYSINMGLKEILSMLDSRFKFVHRSCIINKEKVSVYDWNNNKIKMLSGKEVPYLSKKYKKEVDKKWYWKLFDTYFYFLLIL